MRDIREVTFSDNGFLDINWKRYCFRSHISAAENTKPLLTVARDIECLSQLELVLCEAEELKKHAKHVVVVPKDPTFKGQIKSLIPEEYILGFSVPTKYGGTALEPEEFDRPVHLLGGRPDVQRALADRMQVVSFDCNRFTFDARFGDYFDGQVFRPHPKGGYDNCLRASLVNIDELWHNYDNGGSLSHS
ncbi:hypothetical protein K3163_02280 [Qipengyuania sp. 1NDW9]|nr:DUF6610 family protein [Qipengyuania xiapuensis]MBX7492032.1 hypothetical protein [Qipengyuania xiapuensis]